MLPRPLACCPAVHRRLRSDLDAIWISDDLLSTFFQRFCLGVRPFRRGGSSVPGPLEARRRLGKRRLAHCTDAIPSSALQPDSFWSFGNRKSREQWSWEPPTPRAQAENTRAPSGLPRWLADLTPLPIDQATTRTMAQPPAPDTRQRKHMREEIREFRKKLRGAPEEVQEACDTFIRTFNRSLTLGLVSEADLSFALRYVTKGVKKFTLDRVLGETRCQSFYTAVWDGLRMCKVRQPDDFGQEIMCQILKLLSKLRPTPPLRDIAVGVIGACGTPTTLMRGEVLRIVRAWSTIPTRMAANSSKANEANCLDSKISGPSMETVELLVGLLDQLPPEVSRDIVRDTTDFLVADYFPKFTGPARFLRKIRYFWLLVVARTSSTSEFALIDCWRGMDSVRLQDPVSTDYRPNIPRLTMREGCSLLMELWKTCKYVSTPARLEKVFAGLSKKDGHANGVACLLLALKEQGELDWKIVRRLFRFLRLVGRPRAVYYTLNELKGHHLGLPTILYATEIIQMARLEPRYALNMFLLLRSQRNVQVSLTIDGCPQLVLAMIDCPEFSPEDVWALLGVSIEPRRRHMAPPRSLSKARIDLIHDMARAFAQTGHRAPRVALRNVIRCATYLQSHGVPLSSKMTRALSYTGITQSIVGGHSVGSEKVEWILDLVRRAEGDETACELGQAVARWQSESVMEHQRLRRESNPLLTGPVS